MKKIVAMFITLSMILSVSTLGFAKESIKEKVKVGINAEFAPFEYYDEKGNLAGFDIELMNLIGKRAGLEIEYINMPFDKLIPAVVNGEITCAISAITVTKERNSVVDFTTPYLVSRLHTTLEPVEDDTKEEYAIVFKNGLSERLYSGQVGTEEEKLFRLIEVTIGNLIHDDTIDKLIEKYHFQDTFDQDDMDYTFHTATTYVTDSDAMKEAVSGDGPSESVTWKNADNFPSVVETTETLATEKPVGTPPPSIPPSDWAAEYVEKAKEIGIVEWVSFYLYPHDIERRDFCEFVYNLIEVSTEIDWSIPSKSPFKDTDNEKVLALYSMGIINGKSETKFDPGAYLTREEAATIIIRMIHKVMPMEATKMRFEYDDIEDVSPWASDSVQIISNLGLMNGVGDNRFAPKERYTVEQAVATLVRVYEKAQSMEDNESENYSSKIQNTIEVDDFYVEEAIKLIVESGNLAKDKEYIGYYTTDDATTASVLKLGEVDYSKPTNIYHLSADREQIKSNIKSWYGNEAEGFDIEKLLNLNKVSFAALPGMINASYGSQNLAALTMLTNSRGYVMPKDFKDNFALYFEYDGGYSAFVAFSRFGDEVISANMSFVMNGEKDNLFLRINEITQGLGKDSIHISLVK